MSGFTTAIAVTAAALGAVGAIKQGQAQEAAYKSQANMADYQAKMAQIHSDQVQTQAGIEEDAQRQKARQVIGQQLASSAEAGAGLNEDLLRQSIYGEQEDSAAIRYGAALKSAGLADEAALQISNAKIDRARGSEAMQMGYLNAATSLAGAGNSYYGNKKLNAGGTT